MEQLFVACLEKQNKFILFRFLLFFHLCGYIGGGGMIYNKKVLLIEDIKLRLLASGMDNEIMAEEIARKWAMK